jgi:inorganic pyrophosphatase
MLRRFFQDYKTLEGKAVEVDELQPAAAALPVIEEALARYSTVRRRGFKGGKDSGPPTPRERA